MTGWIKLHRKLLEWEWYDDISTCRLFTHLLLRVNFEPKKWHGITIDRGQILTSLNTLAAETGLTRQQVRTALTHLISTHEITQEITHQYTIITICKYDSYQGEENESNTATNTQSNTPLTQEQHSVNTALTLTKEYKEYKEDEELKKKEVISKEKKEKKESEKELDQKFKQALLDLGVSEPIADEWMVVRKMKKKRNTELALRCLVREANKAGISVQEAVEFSAERQYIGFQADWYFNSQYSMKPTQRGGGRRGNGHTLEEMARIVDAGIALNDILGTRNERERNGETWNSTGR